MAKRGKMDCKFICPVCGNVATPADFNGLGADPSRAPQECIGRVGPIAVGAGQPCNFAAYGLVPGPVEVLMPDGRTITVFEFAEDPSRPRSRPAV